MPVIELLTMKIIPNADLLGLRVLATVIQEGGVSQAARSLHVTQPAVSNALAKLRLRLNDPLFVKVGRQIEPTTRAKLLVAETMPHLRALQAAMGEASVFVAAKTRQRFVIGLPDYLETLIAPLLVSRSLEAAPQASIAFRRNSAEDLSAALDRNEIDLALSRTDDVPRWQYAEHVFSERFVVVHSPHTMAASARLTVAQFLRHPHAMVTFTGEGEGQMDTLLSARGKKRRVVALVSSFSALAEIVSQAPLIASVPHPIAYRMAKTHGLSISEFEFKVQPIAIKLVRTRARESDKSLNWLARLVVDSLTQLDAPGKAP
jgi:LysR family transcriptional regulator, mexEF-oprN operon transcriptional activator